MNAAQLLAAAHYTQSSRLLRLFTPLGADKLLAERLHGRESIDGGGFCFLLDALSDDAHIPLKRLIGQAVRLDIQTAGALRPWHGHVTGFQRLASNGGLARYRLRIEPWLALARLRQDSFLFQHLSVKDIADSIFADYQGAGGARWRWQLADAYPLRGTTTQYQESDLDFLTRLLAEEGVYYWFVHEGGEDEGVVGEDRDGAVAGAHTLILADHPDAHAPGVQARIAYQRADSSEPRDTLQRWQARQRLQTSQLGRSSWDYRSVDPRPLQASAPRLGNLPPLIWNDDSGPYRWPTREQGERLLANAAQALTARQRLWQGQSTVRALAPASTFILDDHPAHAGQDEDERRFLVLEVEHTARNNLDEALQQSIDQAFGKTPNGNPGGNTTAAIPFYQNRFTAMPAGLPYRPLTRDGHGLLIHPKPTVHGSQSAIVIGEDAPVHTDRDHRIKIQFHWQRGSNASARAPHPSGEDNAPARARLGAWVRVASAVAGDNWGHAGLPRLGQEVLLDFLAGDIDRPIVTGALYNGQGQADSQANRQQAGAATATGNAPAWFVGETGEHAHPAIYSGIKTQELQNSQDGSVGNGSGYNQLVLDGAPGQERAGLTTTQASSRLHLGAHRQQDDNQRGPGRGHGAELATTAQGALRGGAGLLISAHAQARGDLLEGASEQEEVQRALQLTTALAQSARAQHAQLPGEPAQGGDPGTDLPAAMALNHIADILAATATAEGGQGAKEPETANPAGPDDKNPAGFTPIRATEGGQGQVTAYGEPHLQLSAPRGIALVTPTQAALVSGASSALVGGQDIELIAQGQLSLAAAQGLALYTIGGPPPKNDPSAERGIQLHAADGAVIVQSQQGQSHLAALKTLTLASVTQEASVQGKNQLLLTAGGAYVKLEGSNIQIHAPGSVTFKGGSHGFTGPGSSQSSVSLPPSELKGCAAQGSKGLDAVGEF